MAAATGGAAGGLVDLEKELSCSICTDLLYQPLTCIPCLHTFCGSCLKEWFGWQAVRHNQQQARDGRSRAKPSFSCPSCRAAVRETRPNATVTTLLDMYLSANPAKSKTAEEKAEIGRTYRHGEPVLPAEQVAVDSPVADDDDDDDDDDVAAARDQRLLNQVREMSLREINGDTPTAHQGRDFGSRARAEQTTHHHQPQQQQHRHRRPRSRGSSSRPQTSQGHLGVSSSARSRSTSRRRRSSQRHIEHQSSLRSLLSNSDVESEEMQTEILRQIAEEGLLDGIDLDNIRVEQEDEISERIARAYRRRQRELAMQRESNRRALDTYRPSTNAGRPRSSNGQQDLPPPQLQADQSLSSPAADARPVSRDHRDSHALQPSRRATDNASNAAAPHSTPSGGTGPRPSVENRRATDPLRRGNISAQWRQGAAGISPQPPAMSILENPPSIIQARSQQNSHHRGAHAAQVVPKVACDRCGTQHIEYELHYSCLRCSDNTTSTFDLCRACYVLGKGCLHWFGFGDAAQARFHKQAPANGWPEGTDGPHSLQARRYVKRPDAAAGGVSALVTLETGVFCDVCYQKADGCYWRCERCNEGDWGYCNACVGQARHCTHALLPLATTEDEDEAGVPKLVAMRLSVSCNLCRQAIEYPQSRYHCPQCNDGDYDICSACYSGLVATGRVSAADGPQGTRLCPSGHRMLVLGSEVDAAGLERRLIVEPVLGGWASQRGSQATASVHAARHQGEWTWEERDESGAIHRRNVSSSQGAAAAATQRLGNHGWGTKMTAYWPRVPADGAKDELTFPRFAEISEVVDINGDWCSGVYCRQVGLFPGPYARLS